MSIKTGLTVASMASVLSGCSILSAEPTFELFKAAGSATSYAIAGIPPRAQDTVSHNHGRITEVCIAWNPTVPQADFVPALQTALLKQHVNSRVFEGQPSASQCPVWLHYTARMDWGVPPWGTTPQMYVVMASVSLRDPDGRLLAASHYASNGTFELGKWSSVSDQIQPVVKALFPGDAG